jgi:hypothetical protein
MGYTPPIPFININIFYCHLHWLEFIHSILFFPAMRMWVWVWIENDIVYIPKLIPLCRLPMLT